MYICEDVLGQGGYGTCLLTSVGTKKVALKVCYCQPEKPSKRDLIKAEMDMVLSLDHKYVVRAHKTFNIMDLMVLVQDLCQGGVSNH